MSKDHNSITCTHGKGLNCRICYDQRFGLDYKKMKTYIAEFNGRLKNAIGITYKIVDKVQAENEEKALLALYEKYEHISFAKFKEVKE